MKGITILEVQGKYNQAKIFTDVVDEASIAQVYTTSVGRSTLDECPMAYKGMEAILENVGTTAEVLQILRPVYNFKAGDED